MRTIAEDLAGVGLAMNEVAPPMELKRIFAKAAIAGGLGIAALGLSTGIGHAAPTSQDLSTTTFVQGWGVFASSTLRIVALLPRFSDSCGVV
ncbi:hypothetical protein, partial [Mycobacterium sp. 852013-50091_SCH5140682]|uniref:hypothetical protein n=1 Tax=Mycobacterium sp. 852013-50091_SCH5140682 TaxID=1834109 RepID=UPI001E3084F9